MDFLFEVLHISTYTFTPIVHLNLNIINIRIYINIKSMSML